jgi:hypothetical protein
MSNARNISKAENRFVNATGDIVSGNVGIGVPSVVAPFHVGSEGSQGITAWFGDETSFVNNAGYHYSDARVGISGRDSDNTDRGAGIEFTSRNTGNSNWLHGYIVHERTGALTVGTGGAGTASATPRLSIDASGRVTMPYQPAFYVRNHETGTSWTSGTELYGFYDAPVNIGGHMNITTGRFTAPVSGTYYLEFSCQEETYYGQWGSGVFFRIRVNGVDKILFGNDTPGPSDYTDDMFISFGGYVYMNAGDYASVYGDVGGPHVSLERYSGGFGGHLIG